METTFVNVGEYRFQIIENTYFFREKIHSKSFKIGGNIPDCVNVSVSYGNGEPIFAKIPHALYDPECSFDTPLEHGGGSVTMIKTLLQHVHRQLPQINLLEFDDMSNIECATELEKSKGSKNRKIGTHVYSTPLYYFSIAFNGETWYEKHFGARQKDPEKHEAYRTRINNLLNTTEYKNGSNFQQFVVMASLEKEKEKDIRDELQPYYEKAKTLGGFFKSIPKTERCRLVRNWIPSFMEMHLQDVFSNTGWVMDLPGSVMTGGKKRKTRKYYCPGKIVRNPKDYYGRQDVGATINDCFWND